MSVMLALMLLLPLPAAQDDPEAVYREQYANYGDISQMTDLNAQATAYLEFFEGGIDERLIGPVLTGVIQDLTGLTAAGSFDAVYPLADRLASLYPDAGVQAGALALEAAAQAGNSEQIVKYGEPFYERNPSPQIALMLAGAHSQLGHQDDVLKYGKIALESGEFPIRDLFSVAYSMLQDHDRAGREDEAFRLAKEIRAGVTSAPEGVSAQDWKMVQIYMLDLIGRSDFRAGRYSDALKSFDAILALDDHHDKSWYFKGNSMLQMGASVNEACQALANAVVLDGNYSDPARQLLESTYASNAPGATATQYVNQALTQARRDMGL